MKYQSSCSCGDVTLKTDSEPLRVSICHCYACQKRTGSVFGVQARWKLSEAKLAGKTSQWVREVEGEKLTFHFCPRCGSTVYWFIGELPDMVATGVGNFADSSFPKPTVTVFGHRKHSWVLMPEGIQHYNEVNQ